MSSTSEAGHGKNAASLEKLLASVISYGATYNPSKVSIKLQALQDLSTSVKGSLTVVNQAESVLKSAEAARKIEFEPLNELITKAVNSVKSSDASSEAIKNVKEIARKIQGTRVKPKKTEEQKQELSAKGVEVKENSSSRLSYDSRLENFDKFLKILSGIPQYQPNETELKLTSLTAYYNSLKAKNTAVVNATVALNNARIARNTVMYKDTSGLIDRALDVKSYIKSVFNASSPQYKQIAKIKFERIE